MDSQIYFGLTLAAMVGLGAILYLLAPSISSGKNSLRLIRETGLALLVAGAAIAVFVILFLPEFHLIQRDHLP